MSESVFVVGQRVRYPGFAWRDEPKYRYGTVSRIYKGARSLTGDQDFIEVTFDDGQVRGGFIPGGGLQPAPLEIATSK